MSQERTERLLALLLVLTSAQRPLTRRAIRDAVGEYQGGSDAAFERKFERDKEELRACGIPIRLATDAWGEAAGYELEQAEMFLPSIEFDASERLVLTLAARAWGRGALSGLRKLEASVGPVAPEAERLRVESRVDSQALAAVMSAIGERRGVGFDYRGTNDSAPLRRRVQPWGISAQRHHWYLIGYDLDRQARRVFRMSRVAGPVSSEGPRHAYEIPDGTDLGTIPSGWDDEPDVSATVLLRPGAGHALRLLGRPISRTEAADADSADGFEAIRIDAVRPRSLVREVLRCGSTAWLLEPAELVDQVQAALRRLISSADASSALSAAELERVLASAAATATTSKRSAGAADAPDRLARLLAIVPWLKANPGVSLPVAARRFGVTVDQLRDDLALAVCTEFGAFHSTLDIDFYGSTLTVRDSQGMDRPFRLSSHEAAALLLGLAIIANAVPGNDAAAIERVAGKLRAAAATSEPSDDPLARVEVVQAAAKPSEYEDVVGQALRDGRALRLGYWSASRDSVMERVVEPVELTWSDGLGYLDAWCRTAQARRTFRMDRIVSATVLAEPVAPADAVASSSTVNPIGPRAVLIVDRSMTWWVENTPHDAAIDLADGSIAVALPIASQAWATRSVLAMAGAIRVVTPVELAAQVIAEARSALANY